jgi:hypothetical protein
MLEQVGATRINPSNNYSEDTTIRVTAVDAHTGNILDRFTGSVSIAEDGTHIYSQNGGTLPEEVSITAEGTATFVVQSLAGPKVEGPNGSAPDPAEITAPDYPLWGGDLDIPQWIVSGKQIDPHASGQVYDWFQTRARDLFAAATGDLKTVLNAVSSYSVSGAQTDGMCVTNWVRGPQSPFVCNPYYLYLRLDSASGSVCGNASQNSFANSIYHEARHAYQASLAALPGNDVDGDFLVNNIPVAPTTIFLDTPTLRSVCNESDDIILVLGYWGDNRFDYPGSPDFASYAWEMDAWTFAASH